MPETNASNVTVDRVVGENAIAQLMGRYTPITEDQLRQPNIDIYGAALKTLALSGALGPELTARFETMPAQEYDRTLLESLAPAARAVIYSRAQLESLRSVDPNARLPLADAQRAHELRQRMLQVLDYHLDNAAGDQHAASRQELDFVRSGQGYVDLANDLQTLAKLYRKHAVLLADDKRAYRSADAGDADQLAATIQDHLSSKKSKQRTPEQLLAARAWTFMVNAYEDVCATGRWLTRNQPQYAHLFPPLGEGLRRRIATSAPASEPTPKTPAANG